MQAASNSHHPPALDVEEVGRLVVRLAQLADAIGAAVSDQLVGGRHLVEALSDQLAEGQVETLYTLHTAAAALQRRAAEMEQALALASEQATAAVIAAGRAAEEGIAQAAFEAETRVAGSWEQMAASAAQAVDGIELAGTAMAADVTAGAEQLVAGLAERLAALERRDATVERRLEARVQRVLDSTEASLTQLTSRLAAEADRLALRDALLERERAEEFVRALDDVLGRSGVKARDLRTRVRSALDRRPVGPPVDAARPAAEVPAGQGDAAARAAPAPVPTPARPAAASRPKPRTGQPAAPAVPIKRAGPRKKPPGDQPVGGGVETTRPRAARTRTDKGDTT